MANVHALFWFDVEDCTVTHSDDAAKRLAMMLTHYGVRGTFKVVGQKARMLQQRIRFDVVDELIRHDIGYHSNWHSRRPQIAEVLGPLDWDAGAAAFEKREGPGWEDVCRIFGVAPATYGQPSSTWAPHVFPVLRKWGVPTYVSGFGYVGVDCQPFWYGGLLCTSHMVGKRLNGEPQRHHMGLNFECGKPGELDKHKQTFATSREQLAETGGVISIANHPCTLVLEEWFSTAMKPRELTEAGHEHVEQFVKWVLSRDNVRTTCASELPVLYPDRALGRPFSRDELRALAVGLSDEIAFQRLGDVTVSAAEAFGLLVHCLDGYVSRDAPAAEVLCAPVYNPTSRPHPVVRELSVPWRAFCAVTRSVRESVARHGRVPNAVRFPGGAVAPGDYLAAVARLAVGLLDGGAPPDEVRIRPAACRFEEFVDVAAAERALSSWIVSEGFQAPKMIELAKLGAWTLKPAVLRA